MADALASSVIDALMGLQLGATGQDAGNRFSLDGVTLGAEAHGGLAVRIQKLEATSLRLASGPFVVEIGRLTLRQVVVQARIDEGKPRLNSLEAAEGELSGVKVHGPLTFSREPKKHSRTAAADGTWSLGPLAAVEGTIRAQIVDAHLLFDADVTVPIGRGNIDFNEVTVEHVGPDSSMGVSRLGLYVDAPNGRSYVYQFPSAPIGGVAFERRDGLLGAWVSDRGNLQLQAFAEGLLRQAPRGPAAGFTDEARRLFERTAVSGELKLSDGAFAAPGIRADLVGGADGHNAIRLHSKAVGRGLTVEMAALSVRHAALSAGDKRLACDALTAALVLRVFVERTQMRFAFDVSKLDVSGLRLSLAAAR